MTNEKQLKAILNTLNWNSLRTFGGQFYISNGPEHRHFPIEIATTLDPINMETFIKGIIEFQPIKTETRQEMIRRVIKFGPKVKYNFVLSIDNQMIRRKDFKTPDEALDAYIELRAELLKGNK